MKKTAFNFLKLLLLAIGFFSVASQSAHAAIYTVPTETSTVDGTNFCGGSACTSADTIIIAAGARGNLVLQNFNGNGSYITVTNEVKSPATRVVITGDQSAGWGIFNLYNCKYLDLRGNNDSSLAYGIKVSSNGSTQGNYTSGDVWVYGHSDHLKLGYIETDDTGNTSNNSCGFQIQDFNLTRSDAISDIEIHHNYIHDTRYCGMYLGHNYDSLSDDIPFVNSFSIHDNLLENMGGYGITFKGSNAGTTNIHNNTIKITGLVRTDLVGEFHQGIGTAYLFNSGTAVNIYNNWIEKTKGNGIKIANIGYSSPVVNIYANTIVGCGTGGEDAYSHGVGLSTYVLCPVNVNDNIIIKPTRYGLYAGGGTAGHCDRNLIGGGLGERIATGDGVWTEGSAENSNHYEADISTELNPFHFKNWTDDDNYANDDFTILGNDTTPPSAPSGLSVE